MYTQYIHILIYTCIHYSVYMYIIYWYKYIYMYIYICACISYVYVHVQVKDTYKHDIHICICTGQGQIYIWYTYMYMYRSQRPCPFRRLGWLFASIVPPTWTSSPWWVNAYTHIHIYMYIQIQIQMHIASIVPPTWMSSPWWEHAYTHIHIYAISGGWPSGDDSRTRSWLWMVPHSGPLYEVYTLCCAVFFFAVMRTCGNRWG